MFHILYNSYNSDSPYVQISPSICPNFPNFWEIIFGKLSHTKFILLMMTSSLEIELTFIGKFRKIRWFYTTFLGHTLKATFWRKIGIIFQKFKFVTFLANIYILVINHDAQRPTLRNSAIYFIKLGLIQKLHIVLSNS